MMWTRASMVFVGVLVLGTPVAASPLLRRSPRVVDGAGQIIGTLVDMTGQPGSPNVLRREGKNLVAINVDRYRIHGIAYTAGPVNFYYETADCSGTQYAPQYGTCRHLR